MTRASIDQSRRETQARPLTDMQRRRIIYATGRLGEAIKTELDADERYRSRGEDVLSPDDYYRMGREAGRVGLRVLAEIGPLPELARMMCRRCDNALFSVRDRVTGWCVFCRANRDLAAGREVAL